MRLSNLQNGATAAVVALAGLCISAAAGCGGDERPGQPSPRTVRIAAAANLRFAFDEIIAEFRRTHPNTRARVTYGSSGNFFAQLSNGAPFDLFFSADTEFPRQLVDAGQASAESEFVYAVGQIVVWVPRSSPINVEELGIQAMLDPAARRIAIANPRHAPYGRAAEAALRKLGVYEQVSDRLVLGEDVTQTAQFVESGAADVGIIALSLALAPAMRDKGRNWPVPPDAYPKLEQGGVILNRATDQKAAIEFRDFVTSASGQDIMKRFGFLPPENF
jgi:molybdate transport system substrate-binding protein